MKVSIGSDHHGFEHKERIKIFFDTIDWTDVGAYSAERSDYPLFAHFVAQDIVENRSQKGILLCGTGIGMAIAANRYKGIYAGLAWNQEVARRAKEDDNVTILVLPADYITVEQACIMVHAWITTLYRGGRYQKRLDLIDTLLK